MLPTASWDKFTNILCVRLDNMGDVLMTTPAFRALKNTFAGCKLTLLTSTPGGVISKLIPEIDDVIIFDAPWVKNGPSVSEKPLSDLIKLLKKQAFDAAIIFNTYSQSPFPSAMICYLAGIPRVLAYSKETPYKLITDWLPDPEPQEFIRHEVERQLALIKHVGAKTSDLKLSLKVPAKGVEQAKNTLLASGLDQARPWLVVHPSASEEKRRYPFEKLTVACRSLINQHGFQIVLTGSEAEKDYVLKLQAQLGRQSFSLAGQLSVEQLAALIQEAPLLLANNTGPVHIAAAVGTPVVVLYAKTNPQHTPWQVPSRVFYFDVPENLRSKNIYLQSFYGLDMPQASPWAIVQAVRELLPAAGVRHD